ncbi:MAG: DUF5605 domain-containing protein [Clostridia bacterium]|nr:DUF5605 domain-containing protein [Clostridia bacterium]
MKLTWTQSVERWGVFEAVCSGAQKGNPFVERELIGEFTSDCERKTIYGFYDGGGMYRVRFMPSFQGEYSFFLSGSALDEEVRGSFQVQPPSEGNHGPVYVSNGCHFTYADGTPHFSFGTTCYVWALQSDEQIEATFETLKRAPFNKVRFCVLPKHYDFNLREPRSYPFEGTPMDSSVISSDNFFNFTGKSNGSQWDYERPNPEHFRHLERCISRLMEMGIEADIILFHPYDRWGFSTMTPEQDAFYLDYAVRRFAAYRNVWWSMANEYDLLAEKTTAQWEALADLLCASDPYGHLRSIHNCMAFYDHTRPWITHASIQRQDFYRTTEYTDEWRERYRKPIVNDEIGYEGNIPHGWGNLSPQEIVRRFWEATLRGGYAGHGETYLSDDGILWWSHGGTLKGESPARIAFLRKLVEELPCGLRRLPGAFDELCAGLDSPITMLRGFQPLRLYYYGFARPSYRDFHFAEDERWHVQVIDTWNMTVRDAGVHSGAFRIELPGREYMAIRLDRIE